MVAPALAVIVLVAGAVAVAQYVTDDAATAELVLTEIDGDVHVLSANGESEAVVRGLMLDPRDRITTGSASRAVLSLGDTAGIRLGPSTSVQYVGRDDQAITLELEGGALQATVRPGATALRVGNRGREVLATDGAFGMGLADDGTMVIEMTEGIAAPSGIEGVSQLTAGERVTVQPDGAATTAPIPSDLLLHVEWPAVTRTKEHSLLVAGQTDASALITVRGGQKAVQVRADTTGRFETRIDLVEGAREIVVEAIDPLGKTAIPVQYTITAVFSGPSIRATTSSDGPR